MDDSVSRRKENVYLLQQKLEISSFLFLMHACQLLVTMGTTTYINDEYLDELEHRQDAVVPIISVTKVGHT